MREPLFIDGQWREPARGAFLDVRNPATEAVFAQAAAGTAEDVDAPSGRPAAPSTRARGPG